MFVWVNAPRTTRSAGCSCICPLASRYVTPVAFPPWVVMRRTLQYSRISRRPLFIAFGTVSWIGLALAPTWQPKRSQNPQVLHGTRLMPSGLVYAPELLHVGWGKTL